MNDEAKRLVDTLRENAEWAHANEWETPITLCDNLEAAANMIEKLSPDFESNEWQKSREIFEISSKAIAKLAADRDTWKRRAEAAERDLGMLHHCDTCKHGTEDEWDPCEVCVASDKCGTGWRMSHYEWRGPCAENGGADDETKA